MRCGVTAVADHRADPPGGWCRRL